MNGYLIRTFGCQMNEHDSERIAGLLESDGYAPADEVGDAGVVVLNTCAIRENADNRLYGTLGHLKPLKDRNPALRVIVAGCLAQKDRRGPGPRGGGHHGRATVGGPNEPRSCSSKRPVKPLIDSQA